MDAFPDSVTNSSVSSSPHTPSPRTSVSLDELHPPPMTDASSVSSSEYDSKSYIHDPSSSSHHFASLDYIQFTSEPLSEEPASIDNRLDAAPFWPGANPGASPSAPQPQSAPRGSFLSDLYGGSLKLDEVPDPASTPDHVFLASPSAGYLRSNSDWAVAHGASPPTLHLSPPAEQHFYRRASFPFAGHEHDENYPAGPNFMTPDDPAAMNGAFSHRGDCYVFDDSLPMSADPSALHAHTGDAHYGSVSPPHQYEREDIKLENSSPVIVPTQGTFYRPSSSSSSLSNGSAPPFMNPHAALPVMHTDDAASKETQYLRRRCFNCHTTEPPSWRRSTLNPGKIVCNKCGLYERTHLRPRPHRFDELRAGNKARKATKSHNPSPHGSPKPLVVKKEPKDYDFDHPMRRGSVASVASGSASGHSDWDDAASVYSSSVGSAPPSTFGSPMAPSFSIPRPPSLSQSPPGSREGPIRIPQAPMAALGRPKAATALYPERPPLPRPIPPSADFYARRGSFDTSISAGRRHTVATGMDEVTGWQSMPMAPPTADKSFARKIAAT